MWSGRFSNTEHVDARRVTSPHIFALIHSSPLGWGTDLAVMPTPPVRKKLNSSTEQPIFAGHDPRAEQEREVLVEREVFRDSSTVLLEQRGSAQTGRMNWDSDYWYMGSMFAKSRMVKNSTELYVKCSAMIFNLRRRGQPPRDLAEDRLLVPRCRRLTWRGTTWLGTPRSSPRDGRRRVLRRRWEWCDSADAQALQRGSAGPRELRRLRRLSRGGGDTTRATTDGRGVDGTDWGR